MQGARETEDAALNIWYIQTSAHLPPFFRNGNEGTVSHKHHPPALFLRRPLTRISTHLKLLGTEPTGGADRHVSITARREHTVADTESTG